MYSRKLKGLPMWNRIWRTKTFRVAVLAIIGAAIAAFQGAITWPEAGQAIMIAVLGITGRDAIAKK